MRSIIQRKKIRDYYDVWRLLKTKKFNREKVKLLFLVKCKTKDLTYTGIDQFFPDGIAKTLEPYLETGLTRLGREPLPPLQSMLDELRGLLEELLK